MTAAFDDAYRFNPAYQTVVELVDARAATVQAFIDALRAHASAGGQELSDVNGTTRSILLDIAGSDRMDPWRLHGHVAAGDAFASQPDRTRLRLTFTHAEDPTGNRTSGALRRFWNGQGEATWTELVGLAADDTGAVVIVPHPDDTDTG